MGNGGSTFSTKMTGILGGMGPYASAEFVNTIYECNMPENGEQESPRLILLSDPMIPDRSTSILNQENEEIIRRITTMCDQFKGMEIDRFIIPCMTSHYYCQGFSEDLLSKLINLVDVVLKAVDQNRSTYLLLATVGTYRSCLLEHERIIVPHEHHQQEIHELVYTVLKRHGKDVEKLEMVQERVEQIVGEYVVDGWISGCTEFHLLTKHVLQQKNHRWAILDPLLEIAKNWSDLDCFLEKEAVRAHRTEGVYERVSRI